MDDIERSGNEVSRLLGLISTNFGSFVEVPLVASLLVGEGYSPEEVVPQFADLPRTRYVKDGLSISLLSAQKVPINDEDKSSFLIFKASGERYIAYLPLNQKYSIN